MSICAQGSQTKQNTQDKELKYFTAAAVETIEDKQVQDKACIFALLNRMKIDCDISIKKVAGTAL